MTNYLKVFAITLGLCVAARAQVDTNSQHFYLFTYFLNSVDQAGARIAVSSDGINWQKINNETPIFIPNVSPEHRMRDPYTFYDAHTGIFHVVWTTGWTTQSIGYAMSKDLKTWTPQSAMPVGAQIPGCACCWAPQIMYDDLKDSFMVYWSTEKGTNGKRSYYCMTKNFKDLTVPTMFFDPGYTVIDDDILKVAPGKYYLFFKDERDPNDAGTQSKNIHYVYGPKPQGPWSAVSPWITNPGCEGPSSIKMGNEVWVYFDPYPVWASTYRIVKVTNLDTTASPWPQGPVCKSGSSPFLWSHGHIIEIPRVKVMQLLYKVKDTTTYQAWPTWNYFNGDTTAVITNYPLGKRNTGCGTGVGLGLIPPLIFKARSIYRRKKKKS